MIDWGSFAAGFLTCALAVAAVLFWPRRGEGGPKEASADNWLHVEPGHVVRLRLPLRPQQVIALATHVRQGGRLTVRQLNRLGLSGGDVKALRKELLDREMVELGARDTMIPLPPFRAFLSIEYEVARQSKQFKQ